MLLDHLSDQDDENNDLSTNDYTSDEDESAPAIKPPSAKHGRPATPTTSSISSSGVSNDEENNLSDRDDEEKS